MIKENLIGKKFGKLLVISSAPNKGCRTYWECLCDCGNHTTVTSTHLKTGHTLSCGCYHKQAMKEKLCKQNKIEKLKDITYLYDDKGNKAIIDTKFCDEITKYYWSKHTSGYWVLSKKAAKQAGVILLHQYVIQLNKLKYSKGYHIDHIDRNKSNNTYVNLRIVTPSKNALNRDIDKRNTTGFLGVTKLNKKYRAAIMIDGINYRKSGFNTPEEAYKWRLQKEKEMMTYQ